MPKGILKYDINDPDDFYEWKLANKSVDMCLALQDIKNELRNMLKYEELSDEQYQMVERIQAKIFKILNDYEVNDVG